MTAPPGCTCLRMVLVSGQLAAGSNKCSCRQQGLQQVHVCFCGPQMPSFLQAACSRTQSKCAHTKQDFHPWTPRAAISYHLTVYFSVSSSFPCRVLLPICGSGDDACHRCPNATGA